jgi:DMSO reductase anchor subunit
MHPAYSVIVFTTASGAGYGLLIWLALSGLGLIGAAPPWTGFWAGGFALVLITTGLLASTFHLGHPERAWRAFSQWRTSWLSREGVFAVMTYPLALLFLSNAVWSFLPLIWARLNTVLLCFFCLLTVWATGMIYASLKAIPRWSNVYVMPLYLLFALASGGLLYLLVLSFQGNLNLAGMMVAVLMLCWMLKWRYWYFIDHQKPASDTGSATGLGHLGKVRQLDAPHTSENYLLQEMGYVVARKHSQRLRRMAILLGLLLPVAGIVLAGAAEGLLASLLVFLAVISGFVGVLLERWLFFAEARHAVTLFYGRSL